MAKTEANDLEVLVCSECKAKVLQCDGCGEPFTWEGEAILCDGAYHVCSEACRITCERDGKIE